MDREQYNITINLFALKCIETDPEDPTAESMEFANHSIWSQYTDEEIIEFTGSLRESFKQNIGNITSKEDINGLLLDAIDWDICKEIHRLEGEVR